MTTLEVADDAATANWGSGWRMPTYNELNELRSNCTGIMSTQNGVNGWLFTGPNGNSIFLPAASFRMDSELHNAGSRGYYWSSSLYAGNTSAASDLLFLSGDYYIIISHDFRHCGRSVRPVCVSAQN